MGSLRIGTTLISTIGQLKLGSSNVLAVYDGNVQVFPAPTTTTTTTTSTTTSTTTVAPTTTSTTTSTTTAAPTTTSTTTSTTTAAPTTTSTTTTTTTIAPTTTTTTTSTTTTTTTVFGIQAVIGFSFVNDGSGNVGAKLEVISGTLLDNMGYYSFSNNGYQSTGCSGANVYVGIFNSTLFPPGPSSTTPVYTAAQGVLSAQAISLFVDNQAITSNYQTIVVGGNSYTITGGTNCWDI
jgi:hypothetical protein